MTRKEQREATFELLFEREFRREEAPDEIFYRSTEHRDIDPIKEAYIKNTYFGVIEHEEEIDALITNFHLPKSTLLMLVSAFSSREFMLDVYKTAVEEKYHFFSFGDAMFIY